MQDSTSLDALAFRGLGEALTSKGFVAACESLDCKAPELWAVLDVASGGCGFGSDGRPLMVFERQVFYRETGGRVLDAPSISGRKPGGYGLAGAQQYDRLIKAMEIDRAAALRSASWGIGQLSGVNFGRAGFDDIESFVQAMAVSEDNQLAAFVNYLRRRGLSALLRVENWTEFARQHYGIEYRDGAFEARLRGAYAKFSVGPLPDLEIREVQLNLSYLGYGPGPIDGLLGLWTRSAIADFQADAEIKITGEPDRKTVTGLRERIKAAAQEETDGTYARAAQAAS